MLFKVFALLLALNIAAYAMQSNADEVDNSSHWQTGYWSPIEKQQRPVEVFRASCLKRALVQILNLPAPVAISIHIRKTLRK